MRKIVYGPDERIEIVVDGVTFQCFPPIGTVELAIADIVDQNVETAQATGKTPTKLSGSIATLNKCIDIVVDSWAGEGIVARPEGAVPSSLIPTGVKRKIRDWYFKQFTLEMEDQKN